MVDCLILKKRNKPKRTYSLEEATNERSTMRFLSVALVAAVAVHAQLEHSYGVCHPICCVLPPFVRVRAVLEFWAFRRDRTQPLLLDTPFHERTTLHGANWRVLQTFLLVTELPPLHFDARLSRNEAWDLTQDAFVVWFCRPIHASCWCQIISSHPPRQAKQQVRFKCPYFWNLFSKKRYWFDATNWLSNLRASCLTFEKLSSHSQKGGEHLFFLVSWSFDTW